MFRVYFSVGRGLWQNLSGDSETVLAFLGFGGALEDLLFAAGKTVNAFFVDFGENAIDFILELGLLLEFFLEGGGAVFAEEGGEFGAPDDPDETGGHAAEVTEVAASIDALLDDIENIYTGE